MEYAIGFAAVIGLVVSIIFVCDVTRELVVAARKRKHNKLHGEIAGNWYVEQTHTLGRVGFELAERAQELGKDAHKRIDDTRRHFGRDLLALATTTRDTHLLLCKSMDQLADRVYVLEDIFLKKGGKDAKSSKS